MQTIKDYALTKGIPVREVYRLIEEGIIKTEFIDKSYTRKVQVVKL